jgi:RimJ/RimL family protein N-acetyltransferase
MGASSRADVTLGVLQPSYADAMYRWMLDPEVREGIGLKSEPSLEKTRAWLARASGDPSVRAFAVLVAGEHVGNVVLDEMDERLASARLSVYVGEPRARGSGVGKAAVALALEQGFTRLGLHRIWLTVHALNAPAIAVYASLGLAVEGVLRDGFLLRGERVDALLMSILEPEWRLRASGRRE